MSYTPPWPKEVFDKYKPVRPLGKGGFATVFLAKRKSTSKENGDELVAIKQVQAGTNTETHYAHREIYILKEINHPNIMSLIESWEPNDSTCSATMALTYAKGRTLDYLLKQVGAPSLTFGRVVIAQLIDAVAYLHSHAIIHRDIKPDNVIVKNIRLDDKAISEGGLDEFRWPALREKWHLTLVDFGFARALGPDDLKAEASLKRRLSGSIHNTKHNESEASINEALNDDSGYLSRKKRQNADQDKSRHIVRTLSALGNRDYAAPEIKNKVRKQDSTEKSSHKTVKSTLSPFVSDYGMVVDAFSVGATARFVLTGVPPDESVEELIASHNNPVNKAARWISRKLKKKDDKPRKRYRSSTDIPIEVVRLIKCMTQPNASIRMTVRDARLHPYIDEVIGGNVAFKKETIFLKCAH